MINNPNQRRRDARNRVAVIIVACLVGAAVIAGALSVGTHLLNAHRRMQVVGVLEVAEPCDLMGDAAAGYGDIQRGVQVRITDQTGEQVAAANLGAPTPNDGECDLYFSTDVPRRDGYGFTIANRGTIQFTRAEVESGIVNLTLR